MSKSLHKSSHKLHNIFISCCTCHDMNLSVRWYICKISFFYHLKVVSKTVAGNAGFSDVKTLTVRCWDFRMIRLIFMNKPQYLSTFYMPPDPNSMHSSPDSLLASLQPSNQEYMKQASLQSVASEGDRIDGEFVTSPFL